MSYFDLTHAPVATAARADTTGLGSMTTRPDPEGSGTVNIATRRCLRLRVAWDLRELTDKKNPRLWSLPARLGPVTHHPTRWGVGPQTSMHRHDMQIGAESNLNIPTPHVRAIGQLPVRASTFSTMFRRRVLRVSMRASFACRL